MKNIDDPEVKDNLDPILLFSVLQNTEDGCVERGVYYIPQRGVGIEGFRSDGSVVSVAKHIANASGMLNTVPGVIDPGLDQDAIMQTISDWLRGGKPVEEKAKAEDEDEEEDEEED